MCYVCCTCSAPCDHVLLQVFGGAGGISARERELEGLAHRLEESHLAAHTHHCMHQEGGREEGKHRGKDEEGSDHLSTWSL